MMNSKLTARRAMIPLFALGLIVPACVGDPELGDDELLASDSDENVAEASEALTAVTTTRGPVANSSCNANSTVSLSVLSDFTDSGNKIAPWRSLAVNGTFSLGSGANGVQIRYWIDDDAAKAQTDGVANNAASGTWSWTRNDLTCDNHMFTVCAIPYVNGNACGDLSSRATSGYRVCKSYPFRGCSNAVGIIPDVGASCPTGSDTLTRHMDDEDGIKYLVNNNNDHSGWIGATGSSNNTDLKFCRVDGRRFKPLTSCNSTPPDTSRDYAVLKLGTRCPNGSVEFGKGINNEDSNNANSHYESSGDYSASVYMDAWTAFNFCFFGSASSPSGTMDTFPSIGIPYGVFGRSSLVNAGEASTAGWFRSDDEDSRSDTFYDQNNLGTRASQIITDGTQNTTFYTAKVITSTNQGTGVGCAVCGDGSCQYPENASSCASDCAYCGDQICNNGETPSSCPDDCGFCGDGVCNGDETPSTCSRDCRNGCGDGVCDATELNTCPADCW